MHVKVRCVNPECRKVLRIKSKYAGRRGRCPFCGEKVDVPNVMGELPPPVVSWAQPQHTGEQEEEGFEIVGDDEAFEDDPEDAAPPPPVRRKPLRRDRRSDDREQDEEEADDGTEESRRLDRQRSRQGRSSRRHEEEPEDEEEDDASSSPETDKPPGVRRPRVIFGAPKHDTSAAIMLGVGIFLLVFLGLTPLLDWFSVSGGGQDTVVTGMSWLGGEIIAGASLAAGAVATVGLILFFFLSAKPANDSVAIGGCVAGAWGAAAAVCQVGWIWKSWQTRAAIQQLLKRPPGQARLPELLADNPLFGHQLTPDLSLSAGAGLWVGIAVGLVVAAIFTHLLATRERAGALLVCPGAGILGGIFAVVFVIRPWEGFASGR